VRPTLLAWVPAAAWAAFLFYMSSRPTLPVELASGLDKLAHFAAYLVLGALLAYATSRTGLHPAVAVMLGSLYGASDEIHQSFVPGRTAEVGDWVADTFGALAGVLLFLIVRRALPARSRGSRAEPETTRS
jgi:VanZ family protein